MSSRSGRTERPIERAGLGDEQVLVARGLRPHGVRGELKVALFSDVVDRFAAGVTLSATVDSRRQRLVIETFRPVPGGALIRFRGIETRDQAELLRGVDFGIEQTEVPPSPEGQYYFFELIGCRCIDTERGVLGVVREVTEDGGGVILSVESADGVLLVPFVARYLESVDPSAKQIRVSLPSDLIELCTSKS